MPLSPHLYNGMKTQFAFAPQSASGAEAENLTPETIRNSDMPVIHHENGNTIVMIDARRIRELALSDKGASAYLNEVFDQISKSGMPLRDIKKALTQTEKGFSQILNHKVPVETEANYIDPKHHFRTIVFDDDPPHRDDFAFVDKKRLPPNAQHVDDNYTLYHEVAHAAYGVKEPGADYMAAVETLATQPNSRATLQIIADHRIIYDVLNGKDGIQKTLYGYETGDAIRAALALSETDLQRYASMPPQQRRQALVDGAKKLDNELKSNVEDGMQPELPVARQLEKITGFNLTETFSDPEKFQKTYAAAQKLLKDPNSPFDASSPERKLLQSFVDATRRSADFDTPATEQKAVSAPPSMSRSAFSL